MNYWRAFFLLLLAASSAMAAEPIRLCQDEIEGEPWRKKDRSGLNMVMLGMVESRLSLKFSVENMPWKRCLTMLEQGKFDGVIAASYREERKTIGIYPATTDGHTPDRNRRMSGEDFYFYKLKTGSFSWDGSLITNANKPVGAQQGYSAVALLKGKGILVDDRHRLPEQLMRKVVLGHNSAALLSAGEGDKWLDNTKFNASLEKVSPPFYQSNGYLLFSHQFYEAQRPTAEKIWDSIASVRTSADYHKELKRFGQPTTD